MIQFTRDHAVMGSTDLVLGPDPDLEAGARTFSSHHCVKVSGFLSSGLSTEIVAGMPPDAFYERVHEGIGSEACLEANSPMLGFLWLLVNDDRLFRVIEAVTGCPRIGSFHGRVYRFTESASHHDSWHDDLTENRLIAMSINLSSEAYDGGVLQIRDSTSGEILHEETNTGLGDALIFRLAPGLQHQVTNVRGNRPKTAFAGWFKSSPDFKTLLRDAHRGDQADLAGVR